MVSFSDNIDYKILDENDNILEYLKCVESLNSGPELSSVEDIKYSLKTRPSNIITFVMLLDNTIVATATLIVEKKLRYKNLCCHIEDVGVNPDYRGCGYGQNIVNYCIAVAKNSKCYKIKLNCSEQLISFYKKFGFMLSSNGMVLEFS